MRPALFRFLIPALCLAVAAAPAMAADFNDESAHAWSQRTYGFVTALTGASSTSDAKDRLHAACKGVTGDLMKYGPHMPMWAQTAHSEFCSGTNIIGMNARAACKEYKRARKDFAKVDPGKDPQEVQAAAKAMTDILDTMIAGNGERNACS